MRISDWSSDVCSSDLRKSSGKRVIRKTVLSVRSSLDASREQPANVEALEREEEQQHGDERDHRARHHQLDILDMLARQPGKRDRQRLLVGIVEDDQRRSEEHTSELQSLMRSSYAVFCLKKNTPNDTINNQHTN